MWKITDYKTREMDKEKKWLNIIGQNLRSFRRTIEQESRTCAILPSIHLSCVRKWIS